MLQSPIWRVCWKKKKKKWASDSRNLYKPGDVHSLMVPGDTHATCLHTHLRSPRQTMKWTWVVEILGGSHTESIYFGQGMFHWGVRWPWNETFDPIWKSGSGTQRNPRRRKNEQLHLKNNKTRKKTPRGWSRVKRQVRSGNQWSCVFHMTYGFSRVPWWLRQ